MTATWGQQVDPWNADYGYGQGYDAYAYGATHDPSLYAYNAYAGYPQYPQQARYVNLLKQFLLMMILVVIDFVHFGHLIFFPSPI